MTKKAGKLNSIYVTEQATKADETAIKSDQFSQPERGQTLELHKVKYLHEVAENVVLLCITLE